jgi:hypothetical protein
VIDIKEIRIGLPPWFYLRCLFLSFANLIDFQKAEIELLENSIVVRSFVADVRNVLADAYGYALQLLEEYLQQTKSKVEFPSSGNDKRWVLPAIYRQFGIATSEPISTVLKTYLQRLPNLNENEIQHALYPFSGKGDLAPLSTLNLEFYGYTRGPYFDGRYELDVKLNFHQIMICLAGYFAARTFRSKVEDNWISVLVFPYGIELTKQNFYRNLRGNVANLPGLKPEEGVILWFAINMPPDSPDLMIVGMKDSSGQKPASVSTNLLVPLAAFRTRASTFLTLAEEDSTRRAIMGLLGRSFQKGWQSKRTEADVDDAVEYVKLLYLAAQGSEKDKLELLMRSSRTELFTSNLAGETAKNRHQIAGMARYIATKLLTWT